MDGQISVEHLSRYLFVCHYINLHGKTVLDIASGTGYGSSLMAQKAIQVIGVDISQEAVDYAANHYSLENLTFLQGDCCQIPIPDNSIDILVSFETLEHIDRHDKFFSEIKRVLHPDGFAIISSPNKRQYTDIPHTINPYHVKELYNEEFLSLVSLHFKHTIYLGQNYLLSSVIYPIAGNPHPTERPTEYNADRFIEKDPLYNIVIASDLPLSNLKAFPSAFFYEDTITLNHIRKNSFDEGYIHCQNTFSWKLGHLLLSPFRFIKHHLFK